MMALRTGSAEAVQNVFPLTFILLFISSAFFPTEAMSGVYQTHRGGQPDHLDDRRHALPGGRGLRPRAKRPSSIGVAAVLAALAIWGAHRALRRPTAGVDMTAVAVDATAAHRRGCRWRSRWRSAAWSTILRIPAAVVPLIVMPMFFVIAFSGSFSSPGRPAVVPHRQRLQLVRALRHPPGRRLRRLRHGLQHRARHRDRLLRPPAARARAPGSASSSGRRWRASCAPPSPPSWCSSSASSSAPSCSGGLLGLLALWAAALGMAVISTGWALGVVYRIPDTAGGPDPPDRHLLHHVPVHRQRPRRGPDRLDAARSPS